MQEAKESDGSSASTPVSHRAITLWIENDLFRDTQKDPLKASDAGIICRHFCWTIVLILYMSFWTWSQATLLSNQPPLISSSSQNLYPTSAAINPDTVSYFLVYLKPNLLRYSGSSTNNSLPASDLYSITLSDPIASLFNQGFINGIGPNGCREAVLPFLTQLKSSFSKSQDFPCNGGPVVFPQDFSPITNYNFWAFINVTLQAGSCYVLPCCRPFTPGYFALNVLPLQVANSTETTLSLLSQYIQSPVAEIYSIVSSAPTYNDFNFLTEYLYHPQSYLDVHLDKSVTRSYIQTLFSGTISDNAENNQHFDTISYVLPQPQPPGYNLSAINFYKPPKTYTLVSSTQQNWILSLLASLGGQWTAAVFATGILISTTERLTNHLFQRFKQGKFDKLSKLGQCLASKISCFDVTIPWKKIIRKEREAISTIAAMIENDTSTDSAMKSQTDVPFSSLSLQSNPILNLDPLELTRISGISQVENVEVSTSVTPLAHLQTR